MNQSPSCVICGNELGDPSVSVPVNKYQAGCLYNVLTFGTRLPISQTTLENRIVTGNTCFTCEAKLSEVQSLVEEWEIIQYKIRTLASDFQITLSRTGILVKCVEEEIKCEGEEEPFTPVSVLPVLTRRRSARISPSPAPVLKRKSTARNISPPVLRNKREVRRSSRKRKPKLVDLDPEWMPDEKVTLPNHAFLENEGISASALLPSALHSYSPPLSPSYDPPLSGRISPSVVNKPQSMARQENLAAATADEETGEGLDESLHDPASPQLATAIRDTYAAENHLDDGHMASTSFPEQTMAPLLKKLENLDWNTSSGALTDELGVTEQVQNAVVTKGRLSSMATSDSAIKKRNLSLLRSQRRIAREQAKQEMKLEAQRSKAERRKRLKQRKMRVSEKKKNVGERKRKTRKLSDDNAPRVKCHYPGCKAERADPERLAAHYNWRHLGDRFPYHCTHSDCDKKFQTLIRLLGHRAIHGGKLPYECQHCNQSFARSESLGNHILKTHTENPTKYLCHICSKEVWTQNELAAHMRERHGPKHKCPVADCSREFATLYQLHCHQGNSHKDVYPQFIRPTLMCAECGKTFRSKSRFAEHEMTHQGVPPKIYCCSAPECTFQSSGKQNVRNHFRSVHILTEKTVPCDYAGCDKLFKTDSAKRNHIKGVHMGMKKQAAKETCPICGEIRNRRYMKNHIAVAHTTGNKNDFRCESCERGFPTKMYLERHQQKYPNCVPKEIGPNAAFCDICSTYCSSMAGLKRHIHLKHNPEYRPWGCATCGKTWPIKLYLTRHVCRGVQDGDGEKHEIESVIDIPVLSL